MATRYYIHKPSAEKEAVERWENEGGRLGRNHAYLLDSIGDASLRHVEQAMPSRRHRTRDELSHMKFFHGSDRAKAITVQTVDGERALRQSVFAA